MLLSSLWGLSCHIPYGVKVTIIITTAALGRATGWRGISHMPCVASSACEIWLRLTATGKRGDVSGQYKHRGPRSWTIIVHHDSWVQLDFMVTVFQHSAVTSTLGRVRIWCTNPKDTEGIFKGNSYQIISSNPKESDLCHHLLSRSK